MRVTEGTARPEGGGRAAPGDAPAPARQWPLLAVLGLTVLGLLVIGADPFRQAPRIGALLVGGALLTGAVLRRVLPSAGMLAVRSRFTDVITYGVLGSAIVLSRAHVAAEPVAGDPVPDGGREVHSPLSRDERRPSPPRVGTGAACENSVMDAPIPIKGCPFAVARK